MTTDLGESLVAAYLRHVRGCDLILTNVHLSGTQGELDVVGLARDGGEQQMVWLCEVTTHIRGMNNPTKRPAARRVQEKVERATEFARELFPQAQHHLEIWSPRVRPGLVAELEIVAQSFQSKNITLQFVVNDDYTAAIQRLVDCARNNHSTTGDDAFRMLQILTHVKGTLTV